jgi:thermitase
MKRPPLHVPTAVLVNSGKRFPPMAPRKADDTRVTLARRGLALAASLACLCAAPPAVSAAAVTDIYRWGLDSVNAPASWPISTGAGVGVAVVDTGVQSSNPDLRGRLVGGGWGFDGTTEDSFGHGTSVAGVIAANKDDGFGITGVAPGAAIVPFRAFADDSAPDPNQIAAALDRAGASGARVVNASFSSEPYHRVPWADFRKLEAILASHPSTLYVVAAGNDGNDNDEYPTLPCNLAVANLLCVGAYDTEGRPWADINGATNYGATSVDLFAPGTWIYAPTIGTPSYQFFAGTSMATAFVSGEAALLFAKVPQLTPAQAIGLILGSSRHVAALGSKAASSGAPDALAALQSATVDSDGDGVYDVVDACPSAPHPTVDGCPPPPPPPPPTPSPTASPTPAPTVTPGSEPVPRVKSVKTTVTKCKKHRTCRRSATVNVKPDRTAKVSLRVEYRKCVKHRCRWTRVASKAFTASTRGASVVVRRPKGLAKGSYRAIVVLSSKAGAAKPVIRRFTVR